MISGNWSSYPCSRAGKVGRDGKWWCAIHDPEKVAARRVKLEAKWDVRKQADELRYAVQRCEREVIDAAEKWHANEISATALSEVVGRLKAARKAIR